MSPLVSINGRNLFNATIYPVTLAAKTRFAEIEFHCRMDPDGFGLDITVGVAHYTWMMPAPARVLVLEFSAVAVTEALGVEVSGEGRMGQLSVPLSVETRKPKEEVERTFVAVPFGPETGHLSFGVRVGLH